MTAHYFRCPWCGQEEKRLVRDDLAQFCYAHVPVAPEMTRIGSGDITGDHSDAADKWIRDRETRMAEGYARREAE